MSDSPLVTVVIPFYSNIQGLLKNSVGSALSQRYENLEVIVIDDASPVFAEDELNFIQDARLKIIRHAKNMNGAIARNTGIENAKGEFIAFLDFDDIWYTDKISEQVKMFIDLGGDTRNVIYAKCKIISGNRSFIRPTRELNEGESVAEYLFCSKELIQTSGIFVNAKVAKQVMFDNLERHQDYQFCIALQHAGCRFHLLQSVAYEFNQIPKKVSYTLSESWMAKYLVGEQKHISMCFMQNVILRSMVNNKLYLPSLRYAIKHKLSITKTINTIIRLSIKRILTKVAK
ncbi:MAG: glycosyltransferase family 2 protein, partial [Campylobacterales bacterium]|nr:glycosyltransferase family 2 protein [Campylobacterales bacterium]